MLCNRRLGVTLGFVALVVGATGASAKDKTPAGDALPEVFSKVLECRKLSDASARLACFDTSVAALEQANAQKTVVVISEEKVAETRRGLFGFSLPRLGLFRDDKQDEGLKELVTTIAAVRGGDGAWVFTLEDGAVWQQTDGVFLRKPKAGQAITIRRAALGSYMGRVEDGLGFRIKRIN